MELQIISQRSVVTLTILVLFVSMIPQSCQPVNTGVLINDVQIDSTVFSTNVATQYQNVTYEGNLLVCNNQTFTIENSEFLINGTITVEDTSTLIIRNSKFTTIPSRDSLLGCTSIILVNQSNFIITNATVIFIHPIYPGDVECEIYVQDNAKANITYSTVQTGQVVGLGNSVIHVKNSTLTTTTSWDKFSGVATSDNSTAEIEKSTMDVAFVGANSTVSIKNSVIGWINIEAENSPDKSTINIATSKIGQISAWEATKIYVEDSTVKWLNAWSDADILLVDCHVKNFQIHGDPKLLVGWNLPLFGLVKMPYTWIPYVQLTVAILICVIIVIALGVLLRKRARKKPDSNEKIKIKIKPPY